MQQSKAMSFQILILIASSTFVAGYVPSIEGAHFTGAKTEVILKECKEKNMTGWSDTERVKITEFCHKLEELTSTFLQEFIHAILDGANTTADALANRFDNDLTELLLEYVGSL